jgi:putative ABC transport system substrate-binding protein
MMLSSEPEVVMRRRDLFVLAGGVATWPRAGHAQHPGKVPRIAFLTTTSPPGSAAVQAFVRRLADLGYVEGRNIAIEWRWGLGSTQRFPEFAAEVVGLNVDVILAANSGAALAAQNATKTIPIVIATMEDPVQQGFAASIARPGGNITGLSLQTPDLQGKRLELFKEALPNLARVAVLIDAAGRPRAREIEMKSAETAARALNIGLGPVAEVQRPEEIAGAFATITKEAATDGVLVISGTMIFANRAELGKQALKIPLMCHLRDEAEAGCLMSYGASLTELFRRAAELVDKILKGAMPAELPIEEPKTFEFVVNLKTAKALGLTISPSILARADEVIE